MKKRKKISKAAGKKKQKPVSVATRICSFQDRIISVLKKSFFKKDVNLSIPVKVVLLTGAVYISSLTITTVAFSGVDSNVQSLIWGANILLMAFVASFSTYYFLDRPLGRLAQVMNRAENGDLFVRAKVSSNDELGQLAKNFNHMLTHITNLTATKIQTEHDLLYAQRELKLKAKLGEQSKLIAETNKTLEALVRDLSLLYEVGQGVNSTIEMSDLYQVITEVFQKRLGLDEFAILIKDETGELLHVKAAYGFSDKDHIFDMTFRLGEGITGEVARDGNVIYVGDTTREPRFLHYKGENIIEGSFLSVPLIFKKDVLGVVNFHRPAVNAFSKDEIRLLTLVANQIALAIENAKLYTKTRELSVRDELTGLYNRRHFQTVLQIEWKRAIRFHRSLSLLMIDVDHFKSYNDTYGHLHGDKVLRDMANLLKRNVRELDTLARFGGEEFVVLLPDTNKNGAIAVGEKLRKIVENYRFMEPVAQQVRQITISAGIAAYPDDVSELDDLIDHADIALYDAKDSGRNRVVCYPQLSLPTSLDAARSTKTLVS